MPQKPVTPSLQLRLLGSPQVKQADRAHNISRRKVQALLYYLAMNAGFQPRATLATLLWPESDQRYAFGSLRRHLSELNRLLGPGWIEREQDAVRLAPRADLWVDVAEFQRLLMQCQEHDHPADAVCGRCIEPLTAAVDLYRGDFLAGFTLPDTPDFDDWQRFQAEELRFAFAGALDRLAAAYEEQAMRDEAIAVARRRLNSDSLHESTHYRLMQLYAANGQASDAMRQYERCVQVLKTELDLPPAPETIALYAQIQRGEFPVVSAAAQPASEPPETIRHNLPAPTTPLVGRTQEVDELRTLCCESQRRLVTLLGPGGIGKTRLALAVAQQLVAKERQAVFLVYLAQLRDAETMIPAIADALNFQFQTDGRPGKTQLFAYLAQRPLLLVLDNFEHLLDGVHLIQELLEQCPQVRLLVTSRERLRLTGETLYTLQNLDFPTWETPAGLQRYAAVQLFLETARRVRPAFTLQAEEMQYVARICRMVGGMPLGIILAAGWVEHLAPATIAAELTKGVDLLKTELRDLPERQRNMQAILDYSWQRLTSEEQEVFMRLSIFQGGFNRTTAQAIVGASLPSLARLVDKSLIQPVAGERYEIHELLRQYAEERLTETGVSAALETAHGTYFLTLLHDAEPRLAGAEQLEAIAQIEAELANIRAAWLWAVTANRADLIDYALDGLFCWFWLRRSRQQEGLALIRVAAHCWEPVGWETIQPLWGRLVARQIEQQGPWLVEPVAVRERVERALALAEQENDQAEIAFCRWIVGLTILSEEWQEAPDQIAPAIAYFERAIATYRTNGDHFWLAQILELLGHTYRQMDEYEQAMPFLEESLALRCAQGDRFGLARSFREIAWVRFYQGREQETLDAAERAVALQQELGDQQGVADSRFFLALSLLACGKWERARQLLLPVKVFAEATDSALYRRWSGNASAIAMAMEAHVAHSQSAARLVPHQLTPFSARLMSLTFGLRTSRLLRDLEGYQRNLHKLLALAATQAEMVLCLPYAADIAAEHGDLQEATQLLTLALRHPVVTDNWVSYLTEIALLQQQLQMELPSRAFSGTWSVGATIELQTTVAKLKAV